ncbi:MAG: Gfo/Idh/MocA family oxidoreductase [Actinomycetia bacterium]|nr:Gfo/Idh/MocA family oxidoreductase [Actinomycetes bacterium]
MTRVGIVGLAHVHAAAYAAILTDLDDVELVGVSEPRPELRNGWTSSDVFDDIDALIRARVDAVIVCTQTNEHLAAVRHLADAGVDVLCEKPLATTVDDAREIVEVCDRAGVKLMTAFPMRFSPPLIEGAQWIDERRAGSVLAFMGTNNGRIPTDHAAWFADPVAAGGGAVMDHVVHLVDIMAWWLGAEPIEVYADINKVFHPEVLVETGGVVTITFDDGVIGTIDCSWSRPDNYPVWGGLTIETLGTEGVFAIDAFAERLEMWSRGTSTWVDWGHDPNRSMIEHFIGAVRGDHSLAVTGVDGLRATEVALGTYRSAIAGQPVEV